MFEGSPGVEQIRRDLDWILYCPDLLTSESELDLPAPDAEFDFAPIIRFFDSKAKHRVGYYFESLVRVWLDALPEISEIEQGIVIEDDERTLGELDFLYKNNDQFFHLEVALKYYLYTPEPNHTGSHLIGPNAGDTFERKRDHILDYQLPLGKECRPEIEKSGLFVKGMIFYHPDYPGAEDSPTGLNCRHRRGLWIRRKELDRFGDAERGTVLQKPFWLAPPASAEDWSTLSDRIRASDSNRPLMISLGDSDGQAYHERSRAFIVPDCWPSRHPSKA